MNKISSIPPVYITRVEPKKRSSIKVYIEQGKVVVEKPVIVLKRPTFYVEANIFKRQIYGR